MRVVLHSDPGAFLTHVEPLLAEAPAENHLLHGIVAEVAAATLRVPMLLASIEDFSRVRAAAIAMPPRSLVLTRGAGAAFQLLARHLVASGEPISGVIAPREEADAFAAAWSEQTQEAVVLRHVQILYDLERFAHPDAVAGSFRRADENDAPVLAGWARSFQREVGVFLPADALGFVRAKVKAGQLFVWEDGTLVSMAAATGRTAGVARIGFVFTPPEHRRRKYAAACVAALSRRLLDEGCRRLFLFADAANPGSNALYRGLGWRPLSEFADYSFGGATEGDSPGT